MTRLITIFDKNLNQRVFRLFDENEIVHKIDTNLTISASSASIDVGNNVELTGVLTDENSVPLGGMSVRILKNNVLVDTVTTNSSGVYSKIITGLDIGTYHFHTSYAGNDVYDNALSETVDVSVVGHTYAVTITADKQSILTTESVTITGTVTRDGTGYAGQSVRIFDSGVLVDTVTTDANGDYTKTVSNLTQGTHRFSSQFDVYESSIAVVEVVEHNYSINITADNPIIQSGDTSIITATLLDATDPVINESLSYTLTNKGTVVGSGSALTNSNGQITINYVGAGLGDIDVEVTYGSILQETYEVQDTFFYDDATTDKSSIYDVTNRIIINRQSTGTVTLTHNNNKYDITASSMGNYGLINIPSLTGINKPFELSMDIITMSSDFGFQLNNTYGKFIMGVPQTMFRVVNSNNIFSTHWNTENTQPVSIFNNIKLVCQFNGNTMNVKVYDNNGNTLYNYTSTLASSLNNETNTVNYGLIIYDGSFSFKNLKVKAL